MTNKQLALFIGDTINKAVREKRGRLTAISDQCVINRQEFDPEGIANLHVFQLVRLGKALAGFLPKKRYEQMKSDISREFWDSVENPDDEEEEVESENQEVKDDDDNNE